MLFLFIFFIYFQIILCSQIISNVDYEKNLDSLFEDNNKQNQKFFQFEELETQQNSNDLIDAVENIYKSNSEAQQLRFKMFPTAQFEGVDIVEKLRHKLVGQQGPQGDQGIQGLQGIQGKQGKIGIQGEQGDRGDKGIQGTETHGPKGKKGPKGPKGETGEQGDQGEKGDVGEPGEQGPQGDAGANGKNGQNGIPGIQGPKGQKGDRGQKGDQGPRGLDGQKGKKGDKGPKGPKGPKGDTGEKGDKGPRGDNGRMGILPPLDYLKQLARRIIEDELLKITDEKKYKQITQQNRTDFSENCEEELTDFKQNCQNICESDNCATSIQKYKCCLNFVKTNPTENISLWTAMDLQEDTTKVKLQIDEAITTCQNSEKVSSYIC